MYRYRVSNVQVFGLRYRGRGGERGEGRGRGGDNVVWIIYFVSRIETDRNFDEFNFHVIEYKKSFSSVKGEIRELGEIASVSINNMRQIKSRTFKDMSHWQIRRTECQLVGDRLFRAAALWHVASGWGWRWKRRLHGVLHSLRPLYLCLCPFRGALVTVLSPFLCWTSRALSAPVTNSDIPSIETYFAVTR